MSVKTSTQLKSAFQTGDVPSQQDFSDLIDTMESQDATALDTAQSAVDSATAAVAVVAGITFNYFVVASYNGAWTILGATKNVASLTKVSGSVVKVNFTTALADTNFPVMVSAGLPSAPGGTMSLTRNVAFVQISNLSQSGIGINIPNGTYMIFG
jgi:hypothetical protein